MLNDFLPAIYNNFFPDFISQTEWTEKKATCHDCANFPKYKKDLKCCTYEPFVANYLAGEILENKSLGAKVILSKISNYNFVLPLGIVPSIGFQMKFNHRKSNDFGNKREWLCPYYNTDNNNCSIWQSRSSICSTYFCKSDKGRQGLGLWKKVEEFLTYSETALAEECMVQMGYSPKHMDRCLDFINRYEATEAEKKQKKLTRKQVDEIWDHQQQNEVQFYKRCYRFVKSLNRSEFLEIIGLIGLNLENELWQKIKKMN